MKWHTTNYNAPDFYLIADYWGTQFPKYKNIMCAYQRSTGCQILLRPLFHYIQSVVLVSCYYIIMLCWGGFSVKFHCNVFKSLLDWFCRHVIKYVQICRLNGVYFCCITQHWDIRFPAQISVSEPAEGHYGLASSLL